MTSQKNEDTILGVTVQDPEPVDVNLVEALVGEGKKYKTVEDLARGYLNADRRIEELKTDLGTIKSKDKSLDEIVSLLRNQSATPTPSAEEPVVQPPKGASPENITETVEKVLTAREQANKARECQQKSLQLLTEKYGSQEAGLLIVKKVINGDAKMRDIVDDLSLSNPEAMMKFIVANAPEDQPRGPNTPGVAERPSAEAVVSSGKQLTWSVAQEVRRKDPKTYKSPEFRKRLELAAAAAARRGVDFYTT
jgi:hypothetical protein